MSHHPIEEYDNYHSNNEDLLFSNTPISSPKYNNNNNTTTRTTTTTTLQEPQELTSSSSIQSSEKQHKPLTTSSLANSNQDDSFNSYLQPSEDNDNDFIINDTHELDDPVNISNIINPYDDDDIVNDSTISPSIIYGDLTTVQDLPTSDFNSSIPVPLDMDTPDAMTYAMSHYSATPKLLSLVSPSVLSRACLEARIKTDRAAAAVDNITAVLQDAGNAAVLAVQVELLLQQKTAREAPLLSPLPSSISSSSPLLENADIPTTDNNYTRDNDITDDNVEPSERSSILRNSSTYNNNNGAVPRPNLSSTSHHTIHRNVVPSRYHVRRRSRSSNDTKNNNTTSNNSTTSKANTSSSNTKTDSQNIIGNNTDNTKDDSQNKMMTRATTNSSSSIDNIVTNNDHSKFCKRIICPINTTVCEKIRFRNSSVHSDTEACIVSHVITSSDTNTNDNHRIVLSPTVLNIPAGDKTKAFNLTFTSGNTPGAFKAYVSFESIRGTQPPLVMIVDAIVTSSEKKRPVRSAIKSVPITSSVGNTEKEETGGLLVHPTFFKFTETSSEKGKICTLYNPTTEDVRFEFEYDSNILSIERENDNSSIAAVLTPMQSTSVTFSLKKNHCSTSSTKENLINIYLHTSSNTRTYPTRSISITTTSNSTTVKSKTESKTESVSSSSALVTYNPSDVHILSAKNKGLLYFKSHSIRSEVSEQRHVIYAELCNASRDKTLVVNVAKTLSPFKVRHTKAFSINPRSYVSLPISVYKPKHHHHYSNTIFRTLVRAYSLDSSDDNGGVLATVLEVLVTFK